MRRPTSQSPTSDSRILFLESEMGERALGKYFLVCFSLLRFRCISFVITDSHRNGFCVLSFIDEREYYIATWPVTHACQYGFRSCGWCILFSDLIVFCCTLWNQRNTDTVFCVLAAFVMQCHEVEVLQPNSMRCTLFYLFTVFISLSPPGSSVQLKRVVLLATHTHTHT